VNEVSFRTRPHGSPHSKKKKKRNSEPFKSGMNECLFIQYSRDVVLGQRPRGKDYCLPMGDRHYGPMTTTMTTTMRYTVEREGSRESTVSEGEGADKV
jgi:hypothetical protein